MEVLAGGRVHDRNDTKHVPLVITNAIPCAYPPTPLYRPDPAGGVFTHLFLCQANAT
jgi:hypothetical protein